MIKFFIILCLCFINFSANAVAVKEEEPSNKIIMVDLKPFIVNHFKKSRPVYTIEIAVRLKIKESFKPELVEHMAKIRDDILILLNDYLRNKDNYKQVKYKDIKSIIQNNLKNKYSDNIEKVLVHNIFFK